MSQKVLVAMSGGVDSSVASYLLKQQGYECIGCTMKLYDNEEIGMPAGHTCCSLSDVEDARSVAYRLGMPYYVFSYSGEFRQKVIETFVREYLDGRTPNPCIDCNRYLKFGLLYQRAQELGCDFIATGHYAIIKEKDGKYELHKGADASKDQSYVLYRLTQEQLAHTLFPLGKLSKREVRRIAEENGFLNAHKPDSQDICFVPDGDYAKAVERFSGRPVPEGNIIDTEGNVIGRHKGVVHYTIGQRKGLGISSNAPLYVCGIDSMTSEVILGHREDLYRDRMTVEDVNWIPGGTWAERKCTVQIRYRGPELPCTVFRGGDGCTVVFDVPASAVTPGQSAVFCSEGQILGGGIIGKPSKHSSRGRE